ncbi:alpha/beta hydrolase [Crossiella sp. SN42]|uniref:alpha/beta fold hydrolase n=1 Tax=Crossiella sp. SN42 TaxID=2944808 RepID=UPI00207CC849|nr:alpha/beta hydrolase [Crossiella sp. SN42]MCO1577328.1 alpha/beta hydrolase [Crossiella sp. SN42]
MSTARLSLPWGGHLAYRMTGSGPPLLLLHPVGLDGSWWCDYSAAFADRYQVIAVDLRGHGRSSPIDGPVTLDQLAADVSFLLAEVATSRAQVIGVSLGGMVAQHLALRDPGSVAALVLCATAGGFPQDLRPALRDRGRLDHQGMSGVIPATLRRWFSPAGRAAAIGRSCERTLSAADPASWTAAWAAIAELDTLSRLPQVAAPALVITGAQDTATPPAAARELVAALPSARLSVVEQAWHLGVFERPDPFLAAFTAFLDEVRGRCARA